MTLIVGAAVSNEEHAIVHAAAQHAGLSVTKFIRRAIRRTLRGPWTEERDLEAEYDEIEMAVPISSRLAKFALLWLEMEACEDDEDCSHCRGFLVAFAPDLVLSTDRFRITADGLIEKEPRSGASR
jgi:hypothetical protein